MRYLVKGVEIRSENAAKPASDASRSVIDWLDGRDRTESALDYGCGKLRYTFELHRCSDHIGIVDSKIQLSRIQRIFKEDISVKDFARKTWPSCSIQDLESFWKRPIRKYDFVLCSNVLSAIPNRKIRARSMRAIHFALKKKGTVLFVNQHTNSYFKKMREDKSSRLHLDGWILQKKTKSSYYGILDKDAVIKLTTRYGFSVLDAWVSGQSNFVLVTRR